MNEHIAKRAHESIRRREYCAAGKETRYYILTIKHSNQYYEVQVLEHAAVIASAEIEDRLDWAKREGIHLLLQINPSVELNDITMVHYKDDRPNGRAWLNDSEKVVRQLLSLEQEVARQQINYEFMNRALQRFSTYRARHEEEYQSTERGFKEELFDKVGRALGNLNETAAHELRDGLVQVFSGEGENGNARRSLNKLFSGPVWTDDFLTLLRNTEPDELKHFLQALIDQGITEEVRQQLAVLYQNLLTEGKFPANKMKVETPNQLLAVLLASYNPKEYILYRPNVFGPFVDQLGLTAPKDVVERYALYNQAAYMVLDYAKKSHYNVDDLLDAYHVVYLSGNEGPDLESNGGGNPMEQAAVVQPTNKILYGPPGTGKTYNVIYEALSILNPSVASELQADPSRRDEAVKLFNRYADSNHVMFCTFHQSFSYEEFVEGIRFSEEKEKYEVQDGVFKRLCSAAKAATTERKETYNFNPDQTQFFKMSLGNTLADDDEVYDYCIANGEIALGWGEHVDFSACGDKQAIRKRYEKELPDENAYGVEFIERFKHWMRVGDIVVISHGNKKARAIGRVTGEYSYKADSPIPYHQFRKVQWLYEDNEAMLPVQSILREKSFSQQTIYMFYTKDLNMESIRELVSATREETVHDQQYVLIIDEINRGNISKIFGELITLIEADKRMGQRNELSVTLPYSGDRLRVPSNVHIIGTMNTADRSIALLDTALRRRFEFVEMLPDYSLLPTDAEGVNVRLLLETINQRIEYVYDRDHVIGHAYFLRDRLEAADLTSIMCTKVIPLLQEYFYDDWEQIELVLGGAGKPNDRTYLLNKHHIQANQLFAKGARTMEPSKTRYTVQLHPTVDAFIRIYDRAAGQTVQDDGE